MDNFSNGVSGNSRYNSSDDFNVNFFDNFRDIFLFNFWDKKFSRSNTIIISLRIPWY